MITENQSKTSRGKISEALELLNEAARDKKDELQDMFTDKYAHIKKAVTVEAQKVKDMARDVVAEGEEKIKEAFIKVDDRVRKDPWPYVAGTAIVALLLGYVLGRRK